ncbi:MAG: OsmC family protein [Candidatus Cyclobacteriaceae bacterium M2_1C_046]
MKRTAKAVWKGTGMEGKGALTTPSGVFREQPYSVKTRFENEDGTLGTNPEELIAAAHAGCFSMALSFQLGGAGFPPEELETNAEILMEKSGVHWSIAKITLHLNAKVSGISNDKFQELAKNAKEGCPVSKALSAVPIELKAKLV